MVIFEESLNFEIWLRVKKAFRKLKRTWKTHKKYILSNIEVTPKVCVCVTSVVCVTISCVCHHQLCGVTSVVWCHHQLCGVAISCVVSHQLCGVTSMSHQLCVCVWTLKTSSCCLKYVRQHRLLISLKETLSKNCISKKQLIFLRQFATEDRERYEWNFKSSRVYFRISTKRKNNFRFFGMSMTPLKILLPPAAFMGRKARFWISLRSSKKRLY